MASRVALLGLAVMLLPLPARLVVGDPTVADNLDGTSTAVWDFATPGDYVFNNTEVSGGNVTLARGVTWWNTTTVGDFSAPDSATNIDLATWPGDVAMAATAGPSTLLTLQPGPSGEDSWLDQNVPAANHGGDTTLVLDGRNPESHPILRFDLSAIPASVVIDDAVLSLDQSAGFGNPVTARVYAVSAPWDEAQVTWTDRLTATPWGVAGGDYNPHRIDAPVIDNTLGWKTWNVTALVDVWYRGLLPNYGLIFDPPNPGANSDKTFYSSDYMVDPTLRPKLDIRYRVLGVAADYVSATGGPGIPSDWRNISWSIGSRSLVSDEFNGLALDPVWTWTNLPPSWDVGVTTPGSLHVVSSTGVDLNGATFTGNVLARGVVGNFTATMQLSANPAANGQKAGLLVLVGDRDWYEVSKAMVAGSVDWRARSNADAATTVRAGVASGNPIPAWVQIQRSGNTFTASTSPDGTAWTVQDAYTPTFPYPLKVRLGFFAADGLSGVAHTVDVESLRVDSGNVTAVAVQTRQGDVTPVDGTWTGWSAAYPSPGGSPMAGTSGYAQYRLTFTTAIPDQTPSVGDVSLSWDRYPASGTVETSDLVPGDLAQWGDFSVSDNPNNQTITYEYSLDSGGNWTAVVPPASLSAVSTATGTIRFQASLSTTDPLVSPALSELRLTYKHTLDHLYVVAPASATAGTPFLVTIDARDAGNFTILAWSGPVDLQAKQLDGVTDALGSLSFSQVNITANGTVTVAVTTTVPETIRIRASAGAPFGLSDVIMVSPGPLDHLLLTPNALTTAVAGVQDFTVQGYDAWNNSIPGLNYSWALDASLGSLNASFGTDVRFTAGTVPATGFLNITSGAVTASASIAVTEGPLANLTVAPGSASIAVTGTIAFSAQGYDAWANPIPGLTYSWSLVGPLGTLNVSVGPAVLLTAGSAVTSGIVRVDSGVLNATAAVTLLPGPLATLIVNPASATLPPNASQDFTAQGYDSWGNAIPGLAYAWSVLGGVGSLNSSAGDTVRFTAGATAGNGTVQVDIGTVNVSASITVTSGALATLSITPSNASVGVAGAVPFTAQGYDGFGNPIPGLPYVWVVGGGIGTLNSTTGPAVTVTAGTVAGAGNVRVDSGPLNATASVTVLPGAVASVAVTPGSVSLLPFDGQTFTADAYDAFGNPLAGQNFTWAVTGGVGTLNATWGASVSFTAAPPPANGTVEASVGAVTGAAQVSVGSGPLPWVVLSAPAAGAHLTGLVSIAYTASPDTVLVAFEYDAGSGWTAIGSTAVLAGTFPWDTSGLDFVAGRLRAVAVNNLTISNATTVSPLEVDNTPPAITIGAILDEQAAAGRLIIPYTVAADAVRVDLSYFDVTWNPIGTDATVDGTYTWIPSVLINGVTVRAVAVDEVGLVGSDEVPGVGQVTFGTNPPAIAAVPDLHVRAGAPYVLNLTFYLSDADTPIGALAVSVSDAANVTAASGPYPSLTFLLASPGSYAVTLWVSDGADTVWRILAVTVSAVGPPALTAALPAVAFDEDTVAVNALGASATAYFSDPQGGGLAFAILDASALLSRVAPGGAVDLWAPANWSGAEVLRLRATDASGGFAEAAFAVLVRPVNDSPLLAAIADITADAGGRYVLDLTPFLFDVDTNLSLITVTTDSPYVSVSGHVLTLAFPADQVGATFLITVSDGLGSAARSVRVTLTPPWWRSPFVLASPPLGALAVTAMFVQRRRWRPTKAFLVDERGKPLREFTLDPTCQVTFQQVVEAGALDAVDKSVKVAKYHAQTVKGDALAVVLLAYGPVSLEQVEFARELLVNIQDQFEDSVKVRLDEVRALEAEVWPEKSWIEEQQQEMETQKAAQETQRTEVETVRQGNAEERARLDAEAERQRTASVELAEGGARLKQESDALALRGKEFEVLGASLTERAHGVEAAGAQLDEHRREIESLEARVAPQAADLAVRERSVGERQAFVQEQSMLIMTRAKAQEDRSQNLEQRQADLKKREAEVALAGETAAAQGQELEAARSRFGEHVARQQGDFATREKALREAEERLASEAGAFESTRMEKGRWIATKEIDLEAREQSLAEKERAVRAQAEANAVRLNDLARREEGVEIGEARLEKVQAELDARQVDLGKLEESLTARAAQLREEEARKAEEFRAWQETLESQQAVLRQQRQAFEKEATQRSEAWERRAAEMGRTEKALKEREEKAQARHAAAAGAIEEVNTREAVAVETQRNAQDALARATVGLAETARQRAELDKRQQTLEREAAQVRVQLAAQAKAVETGQSELAQARAALEREAAAKNALLQRALAESSRRTREVEGRFVDVSERESKIAPQEKHLQDMEARITQERSELAAGKRALEAKQQELDQFTVRSREEIGRLQATAEAVQKSREEAAAELQAERERLQRDSSSLQDRLGAKAQELAKREAALAAREAEVARTRQAFEAERGAWTAKREEDFQAIQAKHHAAAEKTHVAETLIGEANQRKALADEAEKVLRSRQEELTRRIVEGERKQAELEKAARALEAKSGHVQEAQRAVDVDRAALEARLRELAARAEQLDAAQDQAAQAGEALRVRQAKLEEEAARAAKAAADLEVRRVGAEARFTAVESKMAEVGQRERSLVADLTRSRELREQLEAREARLGTREAAVAAGEKGLSDRVAAMGRRDAEFQERAEAFDRRAREIEARVGDTDRHRQSTSDAVQEARDLKAEAERTRAEAQETQAQVARSMKVLQKKATELLEQESRLRERDAEVVERASAIEGQAALLSKKERLVARERADREEQQARHEVEIARLKTQVADLEGAAASVTQLEDQKRDLENRVKILQRKALELLDREEALRKREEELPAASR
ncbi:MAG TPA: DNRLRE domain-containing protein [Thermoplasmata archaeon]|nr:DNRLRE domain-containing protein [Thermoplasmata archaeon]